MVEGTWHILGYKKFFFLNIYTFCNLYPPHIMCEVKCRVHYLHISLSFFLLPFATSCHRCRWFWEQISFSYGHPASGEVDCRAQALSQQEQEHERSRWAAEAVCAVRLTGCGGEDRGKWFKHAVNGPRQWFAWALYDRDGANSLGRNTWMRACPNTCQTLVWNLCCLNSIGPTTLGHVDSITDSKACSLLLHHYHHSTKGWLFFIKTDLGSQVMRNTLNHYGQHALKLSAHLCVCMVVCMMCVCMYIVVHIIWNQEMCGLLFQTMSLPGQVWRWRVGWMNAWWICG